MSYNAMIPTASKDLTVMSTFVAAPVGKLSIMLLHAWCGDRSLDERMIEKVMSLGAPLM